MDSYALTIFLCLKFFVDYSFMRCMLVNYQEKFSALIPGDYVKCVETEWNVKLK